MANNAPTRSPVNIMSPSPSPSSFKEPVKEERKEAIITPVDPTSTPASTPTTIMQADSASSFPAPTFFIETSFSGFTPNDSAGSSLFRKWTGQFTALRSDGEKFSVEVAFLQSDTPHVTGPVVQGALEKLMEYRQCGCKPGKGVVCLSHTIEKEEGD